MPTTRRRRSATPSSLASQPALPDQPPWLEHPTLFGLPGRLQQVYDCYLMRLEAARPTGFYRDALRIYERMLS